MENTDESLRFEGTTTTIDYCHGNFLVWNSSEVILLRKEYHIVGNCVGSLSWKPRQNVCLGLPLRLSKIEATYLMQNAPVRLRNSSELSQDFFSEEERIRIGEKRKIQHKIQIKLLKQQKSQKLDKLSPLILSGKNLKRHKNEDPTTSKVDTDCDRSVANCINFEKFKELELLKTTSLRYENTWIDMKIESTFAHSKSLLTAFDVKFTETEKLQYHVFCDLVKQGYYVANGSKFGGHFLVYPGDPVSYHSFYIALCVDSDKELSGYEFSAMGRLACTVKKTLLLCSKPLDGSVQYLSVSWTGLVP